MNCALLNCNRLYAADGGLRPSFYSFVDCLVALDVRLALLTETWLPTGASLPSDQPFQLIAQPARTPTAAPRGRDTAILHSSEVLATPLGASRSASGFADLTACIVNNLDSSTPTLFISAYAPDASRGLQARADFWSRLDNTLHECHRCHPSADVVLGMDANTWWPRWIRSAGPAKTRPPCAQYLMPMACASSRHPMFQHTAPAPSLTSSLSPQA